MKDTNNKITVIVAIISALTSITVAIISSKSATNIKIELKKDAVSYQEQIAELQSHSQLLFDKYDSLENDYNNLKKSYETIMNKNESLKGEVELLKKQISNNNYNSIETNASDEVSVAIKDEWLPLSTSFNIDKSWGAFTRDGDSLKYGEDSFQNGIVSNFGGSMRNFLMRIDGLYFKKMKMSIYSSKNITVQVVDRSSGEVYKGMYVPGNQVVTAEFDIYNASKIDIQSKEMITHAVILGDIFFNN